MTRSSRRNVLAGGAAAIAAIALPAVAQAQAATSAPRNRALFQVTEDDPALWNMIVNNIKNLREGVGSEGAEIELVAYGPGVAMLKADSPVRQRIAEALQSGVHVNACQNTMRNMKLTPADMLPAIGYVPSGVVEVMRKQQQGWAYIRS
jgi:intracellular sulfur oxidation DsrE/DsrF family protein